MLAGLIFATEDAEDRPDTLAATLPFGGATLIEYQARLLGAVGVTHMIVAVSRVTPALLGATSRIGAKGVAVDVVRTAAEAAAKVHPLADVIVVADGLVTTDAVIEWIAAESHEAMVVASDGDGTPGIERVDSTHSWAGLARVPAKRLADVATMPEDYDFQSTLLRHAAQAGAQQLLLPAGTGRTRHGVERSAAALEARGKSVLAALGDRRTAWIDRLLFTPLTGFVLPRLVARNIPSYGPVLAAGLVTVAAGASFALMLPALGLPLAVVACAMLTTGSTLGWLRAEDRLAQAEDEGVMIVAALAVAALGLVAWRVAGDWGGPVAAAATIAAAGIGERLREARQRWSATPAAYLVVLIPFALIGWPTLGLCAAAAYAFATLAAGVEMVRKRA